MRVRRGALFLAACILLTPSMRLKADVKHLALGVNEAV